LAFAAISLSGFGGVLAWARRIMVERRRWFTADQFNEALPLVLLVIVPVSIGAAFRNTGMRQ
jgi:chromate transport protein ChrA